MKRTTLIEIIITLYAILFLYTGISKIIDYPVFKQQIAASPVLEPIAKPIAFLLPIVEFSVIVLLIVPKMRLKGFYSSLGLMLAFTIYVIAILSFSKDLPCSCGGIVSELSWGQHILFNCLFITFSIIGIILEKRQLKNHQVQLSSIMPSV